MEKIENLIDFAVEEKLKGREYSDIELDIRSRGVDKESAEKIMKAADDIFLSVLIERGGQTEKPGFKLDYRFSAYTLIILGLGVTFLTYTGIIDLGGFYLIFYGPIVAGVSMLLFRGNQRSRERKSDFSSPYNRWRQ